MLSSRASRISGAARRPARISASAKIFALLCSLSFLLYVDRVALSSAGGLIQQELGLTNFQLGIAFSAFAYSYFLTQVFGGMIADRFGARGTIAISVGVWVVTTFATGLIGGLTSLFAVRLLLGFGEGAVLPASARAIAQWFPKHRRGLVQGVTHSFSRLGNALTPPLVAALILLFDWRTCFYILAGITVIWLVFWWIFYRDNPADDPTITEAELEALSRSAAPAPAIRVATPWRALLRRVAPTAAVYFCYGWTGWLYFTWLPSFFLHAHDFDIKKSALFASGVFFAGVVGDGLGGVVADRIYTRTGSLLRSRSLLISGSFLASVVCLTPALLSTDMTIITLALSGAFFCIEMSIAPVWLVPVDVAPEHSGTASGIINAGSALAGIISPMIFGLIIDKTGDWTAPFIGSIILLLVGAVIALFIRPELQIDRFGTLSVSSSYLRDGKG